MLMDLRSLDLRYEETEIESLRQQLTERDAELKRINHALNDNRVDLTITAAEAITELRQQLSDSQNQVTLLREALLAVKPLMIPGVTWTCSVGLLIKQMVHDAITNTEPKK